MFQTLICMLFTKCIVVEIYNKSNQLNLSACVISLLLLLSMKYGSKYWHFIVTSVHFRG